MTPDRRQQSEQSEGDVSTMLKVLLTAFAKAVGIVVLLPIVAGLLLCLVFRETDEKNISAAVNMGRLASLPPCDDLQTQNWGGLTWVGFCIECNAQPKDIDRFVADSPGLADATLTTITPSHKLVLESIGDSNSQ